MKGPGALSLVARQVVHAAPDRVFDWWTQPAHLLRWFGPEGAACVGAEVDLKVGGRYRLGNRFPDGTILWISGAFESIERPSRLVYSWGLEPAAPSERVTVRFTARKGSTEVTVVHENIQGAKLREGHEKGWAGCLQGLAVYAENPLPSPG